MFKTIVLALDGSEGSKRATPVAVELAQRDDGRIVIAHIEQDLAAKGGAPIHANEYEVQAEIRKKAEDLTANGVEASVRMSNVMVGGPAAAIAEIADDARADLIVVGTRGHSPVGGLLLGSVTQRLLQVAKRPVLAIPPQAARS